MEHCLDIVLEVLRQDLDFSVLTKDIRSIGICGATSTPKWLMEDISMFIKEKVKELEN
jgi:4-hydroxy-3-methylbut-2-enyl diphosphate reductase